MSNFSITRRLAQTTAEINAKGGFLNHAGARLLNLGIFVTAPFDALRHLGEGIINVSLAPFNACYSYFENTDISVSMRDILNHFAEVINHIALFILAPISVVSPKFMNKMCEKLRPTQHQANSSMTPVEMQQQQIKKSLPQISPSVPIKSASERFYADCKSQMMTYNPNMTDEAAQKIAESVYIDLVERPVSALVHRITTSSEIPHVKLIASFANKTTIVQMDKLLGKGSYKEAYDGYQFTLQPDSKNALKVNVTAIAVLRFINTADKPETGGGDLAAKFQKIKVENDLAEEFSSNNVVKKSENIFLNGSEWLMVSEKLPFFFENIFPKNAICTEKGYNVYPVVPYSTKDLIRGLKGVAKGLDEIHKKGYIHRDIKPANMAIQPKEKRDGQEKTGGKGIVMDLGFLISQEKPQTRALTVHYAPPELVGIEGNWKKKSQTAAGDLWAFGVSVFQIFHPTHRYPYYGIKVSDWRAELSRIKQNPLEFKMSLFRDWPHGEFAEVQSLQELIAKLLSVEASERGTAKEAAGALRKIEKLYKVKESKKARKSKEASL